MYRLTANGSSDTASVSWRTRPGAVLPHQEDEQRAGERQGDEAASGPGMFIASSHPYSEVITDDRDEADEERHRVGADGSGLQPPHTALHPRTMRPTVLTGAVDDAGIDSAPQHTRRHALDRCTITASYISST
jgi:hypothetical protein